MAERRTARGGTGGTTSTRSRRPADRDDQEILDEQEMLDEEPEVRDDDEFLDADESERGGDEDGSAGNGRRRRARSSRSSMTAAEAARAALDQIADLTAKQPEGITGVERTEDGWTVGLELVEDQRIPSSSDILATYEIAIGPDGEMQSYRRIKRYARGRGDTEDM